MLAWPWCTSRGKTPYRIIMFQAVPLVPFKTWAVIQIFCVNIDLLFPASVIVRIALTWFWVMWGTPDWHWPCFLLLLWDLRDLQGDDRLRCQRSLPEGDKKRGKRTWNNTLGSAGIVVECLNMLKFPKHSQGNYFIVVSSLNQATNVNLISHIVAVVIMILIHMHQQVSHVSFNQVTLIERNFKVHF